jgi:hypothetical protein
MSSLIEPSILWKNFGEDPKLAALRSVDIQYKQEIFRPDSPASWIVGFNLEKRHNRNYVSL